MKTMMVVLGVAVMAVVLICQPVVAQDAKSMLTKTTLLQDLYSSIEIGKFSIDRSIRINQRWTDKLSRKTAVQVNTAVPAQAQLNIDNAIKAANALMLESINPERLAIVSMYYKDGMLTLKYAVGASRLTVYVNVKEPKPYFAKEDEALVDAALQTRANIAQRLTGNQQILLPLADVYINGVERLEHILTNGADGLTYDWQGAAYGLTARAGNYTLGLEYRTWDGYIIDTYDSDGRLIERRIYASYARVEPTITLTSLVDNTTNIDLLQKAREYLNGVLNPDVLNIIDWEEHDGVATFSFGLKDGSVIKVSANNSGYVWMNAELETTIKESRNDIASRLGVNIGEVHINGVVVGDIRIDEKGNPYYEEYPHYGITARVGNFTIGLEYTSQEYWDRPVYWDIMPKYRIIDDDYFKRYYRRYTTITLTSFVDNTTGRDYVAEARAGVTDLFNSESGYSEISDWMMMANGTLQLSVSLEHRTYEPYWYWEKYYWPSSVSVGVTINIGSGTVIINPDIVEGVTRARDEAAARLHIGREDVHVNSLTSTYLWYAYDKYMQDGFRLNITTPQFTLYYDYSIAGKKLVLQSLRSNETGIDLLQSAREYLNGALGPDVLTIVDWEESNGVVTFSFALKDGSVIRVNATNSGYVEMNAQLETTIKESRNDIASRLGVDISEVHINGVTGDNLDVGGKYIEWACIPIPTKPYTYPFSHRNGITARVGNFTIGLEYTSQEYWYWDKPYQRYAWEKDPIESYPKWRWPYASYTTITLTSFVDNTTGRDYVAEARVGVTDLFNSESGYSEISDWRMMADGTLQLSVALTGNKYQYPWGIEYSWEKPWSMPIQVTVNPASGTVVIDPVVVECVTKARHEAAARLGIGREEVHVNGFFRTSTYKTDGTVDQDTFTLEVSTPQFTLRYNYSVSDGKLSIQSLTSRETGEDLVWNTQSYIVNNFGVGYESVHINDFTLTNNPDGTPLVEFSVKIDGWQGSFVFGVSTSGEVIYFSYNNKYKDDSSYVYYPQDLKDPTITRYDQEKPVTTWEKNSAPQQIDPEIIQRQEIEAAVTRQAADHFCGQLAGKTEVLNQQQ